MPTSRIRSLRKEFHALDPRERTEWLHKLAQTGELPRS